ncbi:MAG: hypothetical protein IT518_12495 [Burkholderiales bacterium]|nr:hypothetical protein [Burkholderiales bacterium]
MKILPALACAAILASTPAFACDDMRAGGDGGDGGAYQASKAPEATVAAAEKQAPLTVTTKKQPVKKAATGKPLPSNSVSMARTNQ